MNHVLDTGQKVSPILAAIFIATQWGVGREGTEALEVSGLTLDSGNSEIVSKGVGLESGSNRQQSPGSCINTHMWLEPTGCLGLD